MRANAPARSAAGLQLTRLRDAFLDEGFLLLIQNQGSNGLGHGVRRIQVQSFTRQLLGFPPIAFYDGVGLLHQAFARTARARELFSSSS